MHGGCFRHVLSTGSLEGTGRKIPIEKRSDSEASTHLIPRHVHERIALDAHPVA